MTTDTTTGFKLNGHDTEPEQESQEQLTAVFKKLSDLKRGDGSLVTLGKQELSLLQKMLSTGTEEYREQQMWRMGSFMDEDEALDHVAAFYEAKDLGMDTSFNVAYMFALCSVNRKGNFANNLLAILTDTLQHGKWANAPEGKKQHGNSNPRSPLSN